MSPSGWTPGPRNHLCDVSGLAIGHSGDERMKSGTSVVIFDRPAVASVCVLGGAPGTRETDLLQPENTVAGVDALVLSGGSAFGLDAAAGAQAYLREVGRGYAVAGRTVPIVPAAILFDLANGGDKTRGWDRYPPYRDFGYEAAETAAPDNDRLGSVGAGIGCTTATAKGGLGSASSVLSNGITVAALVAVNALGSVLVGSTRHFLAAPFEHGEEFGGLGVPNPLPQDAMALRTKLGAGSGTNTTIGILVTDAILDKPSAKRLAIAGQDGVARAIWPAHTDLDGDLIFAAATGSSGLRLVGGEALSIELAAAASATMARAIARGIYAARKADGDPFAPWQDLPA